MTENLQPATKTDIERLESKLDRHLEMATANKTSIEWLKMAIVSAWVAILGLVGLGK